MFNLIITAAILISFFYRMSFNKGIILDSEYFSVTKTLYIKGILCIMIVLNHISGIVFPDTIYLKPFHAVGFLVVAIFFFISGYGIEYQYIHKKDYLESFLVKRIPNILIPLFITNFFYVIAYWIIGNLEINNVLDCILYTFDILGIFVVNRSAWYIRTLLILYVMYYFVKKHITNEKKGYTIMFLFILLLTVFRGIFYQESTGTGQDFGMCFCLLSGILWCKHEKTLIKYLNKHYTLCLLITFLITSIFLGGFMLSYNNVFIGKFLCRNIGTFMFTIFFIIFIAKINIGNNLLGYLGRISAEIYLLHRCIIDCVISIPSIKAKYFLILFSTIVISIFVHSLIEKIIKILNDLYLQGAFKKRL